jgi:hypothetical protein
MSVPTEANKRGLNNVARTFTATDSSVHYYIEFGTIWIFQGAGAVDESSYTIAGTIPAGSIHINTSNGVMSKYTGSAWETVTCS